MLRQQACRVLWAWVADCANQSVSVQQEGKATVKQVMHFSNNCKIPLALQLLNDRKTLAECRLAGQRDARPQLKELTFSRKVVDELYQQERYCACVYEIYCVLLIIIIVVIFIGPDCLGGTGHLIDIIGRSARSARSPSHKAFCRSREVVGQIDTIRDFADRARLYICRLRLYRVEQFSAVSMPVCSTSLTVSVYRT